MHCLKRTCVGLLHVMFVECILRIVAIWSLCFNTFVLSYVLMMRPWALDRSDWKCNLIVSLMESNWSDGLVAVFSDSRNREVDLLTVFHYNVLIESYLMCGKYLLLSSSRFLLLKNRWVSPIFRSNSVPVSVHVMIVPLIAIIRIPPCALWIASQCLELYFVLQTRKLTIKWLIIV